jgi:hypothetical protein
VVRLLDADKHNIISRKVSEKEMPNYWLKNLKLRMAGPSGIKRRKVLAHPK